MSRFIAQNRINNKLEENVIGLSVEAKNAKLKDPEVINATIGSYIHEDGSFHLFEPVKKVLKEGSPNDNLSYAPVDGGEAFKKTVIEWVLGNDLDESYYVKAVATPGGTGAISMALATYADVGSTVLIPEYHWPCYNQIAKNLGLKTKTYSLIDDEFNFDIESFISEVKELNSFEHVCVIINDPCNNPTGFSMSKEDYDILVQRLSELELTNNLTILLDIAYLDFGPAFGNEARKSFNKMLTLTDKINILFAFSASKSLGIYGLRLGALIHVTKDEQESLEFAEKGVFFARSTWSNTNHLAINIFSKWLSNEEYRRSTLSEINSLSREINIRGEILYNRIKDTNIPVVKYRGGFFMYIKDEEGFLSEELRKYKVYAIKMGKGVRIAICSISLTEASRLADILIKIYN